MADRVGLTSEQVQPWLATLFPDSSTGLSVVPLAADASTQRYFRAQWRSQQTGQSVSRVIMVCNPWSPTTPPAFYCGGPAFSGERRAGAGD